MSAPVFPHGDPNTLARRIVSDPRFTGLTSATKPEPSLLERFLNWIAQGLAHIFRAFGHTLGGNNPLGMFIIALVVVAVLCGIVYIVIRIGNRYALVRSGPLRSTRSSALELESSAADLRAAAVAAAAEGRYRTADALLFVSAQRALAERGTVRYDPARTPGEYRRLVRDPQFDMLAKDATIALFDLAEPERASFERMSLAYDRFFMESARG